MHNLISLLLRCENFFIKIAKFSYGKSCQIAAVEKKSNSVQNSLKNDNLLEPCYMAIYYEIGDLDTKLSKISIFTEICREKNQAKRCTPKLEGKRGMVS